MDIVTTYAPPPIPSRAYDWAAIDRDSYSGNDTDPIGYGATEEAAIADLISQLDFE